MKRFPNGKGDVNKYIKVKHMLSDLYKEYLKYSHFKNKLDLNIDNEWRPASTATTWEALSHICRPNVCQHRCQQPSRKPAAVSRTFTHRWLCC